jgi:AcrR family transcriptional regulator
VANAAVPRRRRGREATAAAILSAAEELFAKRGYNAVTVRDIAHRAGVSHALVHQYIGTKADVFRSVLARNEGLILAAAPDNTDMFESVALMARQALTPRGRTHLRLIVRSALSGLRYKQTPGKFAATERLIELAEELAGTATDGERGEKDLDVRIAVACLVSALLGWAATESWIRPAAGLEGVPEGELIDGVVRVLAGMGRWAEALQAARGTLAIDGNMPDSLRIAAAKIGRAHV